MSKILIIAYHFHPDLEVGAVRSIKFARYLPEFGWEPHILTINLDLIPKKDSSELGFECPIYRTSKLPTFDDFYLWLKKIIRGGKNNPGQQARVASPANKGINEDTSLAATNKMPLWKRLINSISATPDDKIGWLFPASYRAIRIIRKQKIDIVYSSGPPYTSHLIGYLAKTFTGTKWVADFRDPWTTCVRLGSHFNAVSSWVEKRMESAVISKADYILTATPDIANQLLDLHKKQFAGKNSTIHNGFDEEDFRGKIKRAKEQNEPMKFLYAGTLYLGRDPSLIFMALSELISDGCLEKSSIRFEFVGNYEFSDMNLQNIISSMGLEEIIRLRSSVDRNEYFNLILDADVLILMQSEMARPQIPGKTYEYLATGNAILALVPDGATRDLLYKFKNVQISDPEDKKRIKECILNLSKRKETGAPTRTGDNLNELTRRNQTSKLSTILNKLTIIER